MSKSITVNPDELDALGARLSRYSQQIEQVARDHPDSQPGLTSSALVELSNAIFEEAKTVRKIANS